jgi:hypothetical protein
MDRTYIYRRAVRAVVSQLGVARLHLAASDWLFRLNVGTAPSSTTCCCDLTCNLLCKLPDINVPHGRVAHTGESLTFAKTPPKLT